MRGNEPGGENASAQTARRVGQGGRNLSQVPVSLGRFAGLRSSLSFRSESRPQSPQRAHPAEAGQRPPGVADEPASEENPPVACRHPAVGPAPQIGGRDERIPLDRQHHTREPVAPPQDDVFARARQRELLAARSPTPRREGEPETARSFRPRPPPLAYWHRAAVLPVRPAAPSAAGTGQRPVQSGDPSRSGVS